MSEEILESIENRMETLKDDKKVNSHELGQLDSSVDGAIYELSRLKKLIEKGIIEIPDNSSTSDEVEQ